MGQRWLEEKEHATFVCQFSNLLTLNGIIIQLAISRGWEPIHKGQALLG